MPADARDPGSGLVLRPFRATRYGAAVGRDIDAVTSPPYDVIDEETVDRLYASHAYNVVRLILPRRFARAPSYDGVSDLLAQWQRTGVLVLDPDPGLYVYEYTVGGHTVRSLVGALGLRERSAATVLPHEDVMPGPVEDRAELISRTGTNLEPILLVYDGDGAASDVADTVTDRHLLISCVAPDGSSHTVWRITDPSALQRISDDLAPRRVLIADGHHRYAAYQRVQASRADGRVACDSGAEAGYDYGLALLVDQRRYPLQLGPIHRVVSGLGLAELIRRTPGGDSSTTDYAGTAKSTRTRCTSACFRTGASRSSRCTTSTTPSTPCRRHAATPASPCSCTRRRWRRWSPRPNRDAACRASRRRSARSRGWAC